jgi:hypothetical protein
VERRDTHHLARVGAHDRLSSQFLHGQSRGSATSIVDQIDGLRTVPRETQQNHPFSIDAIVVLPDHLHTVWTLPGCGFLHAVAAHQDVIFLKARCRGANFQQLRR